MIKFYLEFCHQQSFFFPNQNYWLNWDRFASQTSLVLSKAIEAAALPEYTSQNQLENQSPPQILCSIKLFITDAFLLCCMPVVSAWLPCCCAAGIISLQMSAALSKADLTVSHTGLDAAASL